MPFSSRVAAGAVLALTAALLPASAHAAARPDLVVSALSVSSGSVTRGAAVTIRDTTRNIGAHAAGRSTTGYYLSRDRVRSSTDRSLGSRGVPALGVRRSSSGRHTAVIPATTGAGHWYVLACADVTRKVAEAKEGNNCRSVALTVTAPSASTGAFPQQPNPLTVTPSYGTGTVTSGYAYAYADDPNSFTVTAADGTTYTLDLPAGAVPQSVALTLTPLTGLGGAPTSLLGGVRIQPTGLRLLKNATLTVTPAATLPASGLVALRSYDGGADTGLYPIDTTGSTATSVALSINELATYAVGTSSSAQVAAALAHPPTRGDGQLDNVLGGLGAGAVVAARPLAPRTGAPLTEISAADEYYDHVLKPDLVAAETNDANARSALAAALGWSHQMAVLGGESDPRIADSITEMLKILLNAVNQEYTRCKTDHQLQDLGRLLGNARTYGALGAQADADNTFAKAQACGRFTFAFDDTMTQDQYYPPGQSGYNLHSSLEVHTAAPVLMQLNQFGAFQGTGTIDYVDATYTGVTTVPGSGCTLTTTQTITGTHPGTADGVTLTLSVDLSVNFVQPGSGVTLAPTKDGVISMSAPGFAAFPSEDFHSQNAGCSSSGYDHTDQMWALQVHHYPGGGSATPIIPIPPAAQDGASVFDHTYTWDNGGAGDISGAHATETTLVTVTHVPQ